MKSIKRMSIWLAAVLVVTLLASMLVACNDKGSAVDETAGMTETSNIEVTVPDTNNEKEDEAEANVEEEPVQDERADEPTQKQPGSLDMSINGGAVWGYYGLGNTGEKAPIGDLIEGSFGDMARERGWTVRVELHKALEGEEPSQQSAQERAEAFAPNIVAEDGGAVECLVYVLYDADLNDAYVYMAGEDLPNIDTAYIESIFEDEAVADPYDRVVNGINALADALGQGM